MSSDIQHRPPQVTQTPGVVPTSGAHFQASTVTSEAAEVAELQRLADTMPAKSVSPLPDAKTDVFVAPVRTDKTEDLRTLGDGAALAGNGIIANIMGVLFVGIISGGITVGVSANPGVNGWLVWGSIMLGAGIVGNGAMVLTWLAMRPAYRRLTRLNALAFTRWLRLRYGVIVDPATLGSLQYELNNENTIGELGQTIADVNGRHFTLYRPKKGGVAVKFDLDDMTGQPALDPATQAKLVHSAAVEDLFTNGDLGEDYATLQATLTKLASHKLDADSAHTIDRIHGDIEDMKTLAGQLLDLHPLTDTQRAMLISTLTALNTEATGVLTAVGANAERALEIQYRYIQERQGQGDLSLVKAKDRPQTGD